LVLSKYIKPIFLAFNPDEGADGGKTPLLWANLELSHYCSIKMYNKNQFQMFRCNWTWWWTSV